jgi:hypothetical protein
MDTTTSQTEAGFDFLKKGLRPTEVIYENQVQKNTDNAKKFFENEKNWLRLEQAEIVRDKHLDAGASLDEAMRAGYNSVMVAENLPINSEVMLGIDLQVAAQKDDKNWLDYAAVGGLGVLLGLSVMDVTPNKLIKTGLRAGGRKIKENTKKLVDVFKNTKFLNDMPVKENTVEVFGKKIKLDSNAELPYKQESYDTQRVYNMSPLSGDTPMNLSFSGINTYSPTLEALRSVNTDVNQAIKPSDIMRYLKNIPEDNEAILNSTRAELLANISFIKFYENLGVLPKNWDDQFRAANGKIKSADGDKRIQAAELMVERHFEVAFHPNTLGRDAAEILPERKKYFINLNNKFINGLNRRLTLPMTNTDSAEFLVDVYDSRNSFKSGIGKSQAIEYEVSKRNLPKLAESDLYTQSYDLRGQPKNQFSITPSTDKVTKLGKDNVVMTTAGLGREYDPSKVDFSSYPFNQQRQEGVGLLNLNNLPQEDIVIVLRNVGKLKSETPGTGRFIRQTIKNPDKIEGIAFGLNDANSLTEFKYGKQPSLEESINFITKPLTKDGLSPFDANVTSVINDLYVKVGIEQARKEGGEKLVKQFMKLVFEAEPETLNKLSGKFVDNYVNKTRIGEFEFPLPTYDFPTRKRNINLNDTTQNLTNYLQSSDFDAMEFGGRQGSAKTITEAFRNSNIVKPTDKDSLDNFFNYYRKTSTIANAPNLLGKKVATTGPIGTHGFGVDTIAHIRTTKQGDSIFINEIQSDLFQKKYNAVFRTNFDEALNVQIGGLTDKIKSPNSFTDFYFDKIDEGFAPVELLSEAELTKVAKDYGIDLKARLGRDIQTTTDQLNAVDKLLDMGVPINKAVKKIYNESYKDIFGKSRSKILKEVTAKTKQDLKLNPKLPVNSTEEIVEKLLLSTILDAKKRGAKYIVLPNLDKIGEARNFSNSVKKEGESFTFLFSKNNLGSKYASLNNGKFPETAEEFLDVTSRKDGKPFQSIFYDIEDAEIEGAIPQNFKDTYEISFDKAVANLVKKSNGKIKARVGTQDYSPRTSQFTEDDIESIYNTHHKIKIGKEDKVPNDKLDLYMDFIEFYNSDTIKEPVKIIDITNILNDMEDLTFTRVGLAEGGLVA